MDALFYPDNLVSFIILGALALVICWKAREATPAIKKILFLPFLLFFLGNIAYVLFFVLNPASAWSVDMLLTNTHAWSIIMMLASLASLLAFLGHACIVLRTYSTTKFIEALILIAAILQIIPFQSELVVGISEAALVLVVAYATAGLFRVQKLPRGIALGWIAYLAGTVLDVIGGATYTNSILFIFGSASVLYGLVLTKTTKSAT